MFNDMITDYLSIALLVGVLLVAAAIDHRYHRIPNLLTYPTMVIALTFHGLTNGLDGLLFSAGGVAMGIGILILPYMIGVMGAGDAKLLGAVGAILGARGVFITFLFTAVIGGAYALIVLIIRSEYRKDFIGRWGAVFKTFAFTGQFITIDAAKKVKAPELPYGIAIALGTLVYVILQLSGYRFPV